MKKRTTDERSTFLQRSGWVSKQDSCQRDFYFNSQNISKQLRQLWHGVTRNEEVAPDQMFRQKLTEQGGRHS